MSTMSQYYSNDNTPQQNNREPPHLLSSSFIQPELNSQAQHFSNNMSESGYQTTTDQFRMHAHSSSLGQTSAPISEPPPYDEFVEYSWPTEIATNLTLPHDNIGSQLFNSEDHNFIFHEFLGNLHDNENFIFSPSLPMNMPIYPNTISDNNDSSLSPSIVDSVYNILPPGQMSPTSPTTADLLNRNQFTSSNSTSLSPRTKSITISSPPPSNNVNGHDIDGDDDVSSPGGEKADGSSTPTVPSKRKQDDDDRNRRRASIPRLNPINTKFTMTQSNSNNVSKPLSPSMQLSNLSINNGKSNNNNNNNNSGNSGDNNNNSNNSNHNNNNLNLNLNHNQSNYDDSQCNTPTSSINSSPRSPSREIINQKNEDEDLVSGTTSTNNLSSIDDQNDEFSPAEIKTEESPSSSSSSASTSKQTPQKSSRKPYKELLTEEEKRANHIASEQKRRNTIRAGFKELTDIIPTLKNVNNSKSTILFKAVDYIKYLERRNRNLKERAGLLEMRVEMEMRQGKRFHHHHPHGNPFGPNTMGFGHQRVSPMPMSYGVIPNGMAAIPIGPSGHPPQRQPPHVMTPHPIYFVPSTENPSIIPAGSVVSPTNNNIFNRGGSAMGMQIQQQGHHHPQQDNVPGMNIPTITSDDDGNNGVDIDGDSSMLGMNGSATVRGVGVKC